ncbi:WD40-like protein [Leptospira ryugenii]|uniref:WD40-like protein n=1 Tax=Leptospira ryugenii TaxID=1917863 RepID=A0A2P2E0Y2_9LEPT|nr:biopolymer transporter TolR [Leptospira ryugenii]GBF50539.1 WD40-like protein [Leptospira ryugenii]
MSRTTSSKLSLFFLSTLLQCTLLQSGVKINPVTFDYQSISKNYFKPGETKPFPLTVQRGNNLYNSTTADGRFLFYTTDKNGNNDIWFRDLKSSVIVPVTENSFSESKPAISPDGKYLVFVSEEFDSDGDLVLLEMNIEEWMEELLKGNRFIETDTINLTNPLAKKEGKRQRIIDTDPVWTPDGKYVLYVSDAFTPGIPNLVQINPFRPQEKTLLTQNGAVNPSLSKDGSVVYFISYGEDNRGEVYSFQIQSKEIQRITNNAFLDFSPCVDQLGKYLYYASIRKDSNGNGKLDERDVSLLVMRNLQTGEEKVLSSGEVSFFDVKYSTFNGGSVLFSAPYFNSINIYFLPATGSIPKQSNIIEQYQSTKTFLDGQSLEAYFLGLNSMELFFSQDPLFPIYQAKVNDLKAKAYEKMGKSKEAKQIYSGMQSGELGRDTAFGFAFARWLAQNPATKNQELLQFINSHSDVSIDTIPSLLHLLVDDFEKKKDIPSTKRYLIEITDRYPEYHLISEIRRKLGTYEFTQDSKTLPIVYKQIFKNWKDEAERSLTRNEQNFDFNTKRDLRYLIEDIILKIESNRSPGEVLQWVDILLSEADNQSEDLFKQILLFEKAKALHSLRDFANSSLLLDQIIPIPPQMDLEPIGKPSVFELPVYKVAYKNPILLKSHILKYQNQKYSGNTGDALRNLKVYLEFYDKDLGVDLKISDIENAFFYFENKALEFERLGNLRESAFHYFYNNQNMFLVKTKNLFLDSLYQEYGVYYQRRMVDTIFNYGKKLREEEERALLSQINVLGKDKLNVIGNITDVTSLVTENKYLRSVVDLKDLEQINVLSGQALQWAELYYKQAVPRARPHLDLSTLYGYAYFLINKYVIYESYYYATNTMTDLRKKEILENYKKAEWELKWIIFADPTYHDAYQLLGWLYQYVDLMKLRRAEPGAETDEEKYLALYKKFFPEKNLEANVELYNQILVFLGQKNLKPKVLSDLNLNLGNNYFLLNNYPKADESFQKVEESSKTLLAKNQFESYKQEAVFRYHYGRALIYQSEYKKAISQFQSSIQIYFKNEYYQAVNAYASDENTITKERLMNIRSKLALLFALKGLAELESQQFTPAIESFQTSIAYNQQTQFLHPINLYNYLAIAMQKAGRFQSSYEMLSIAKQEYQKSKKSLWQRWKNFSSWDLVLPEDKRVIGEGRFPGEFPDDFKYLLTLGVSIENHIEQREFELALQELSARNDFIKEKSLDKTAMGTTILAKSKQVAAQIYYENKVSENALKSYEDLIQLVFANGSPDSKEKAIAGYSTSVFSFVEANKENTEKATKALKDLLANLEIWKSDFMKSCSDKLCDLQFRKKYYKYDVIRGTANFYLAELSVGNPEISFSRYAEAAEILENPGLVDPIDIGLPKDPIRKKERIRLLYNLAFIYRRLGDIELSRKKWNEAAELAYEFRFDDELFWLHQQKIEMESGLANLSKQNLDLQNSVKKVQKDWKESPEIRLFSPRVKIDRLVNTLSKYYLEQKNFSALVQLWEERRSIELFREVFNSQFEFEDSKLNLAYSDLLNWIKRYRTLLKTMETKSENRENVDNLLKSKQIEIQKLEAYTSKLNSLSPERNSFWSIFWNPKERFTLDNRILYVYHSENQYHLFSERNKNIFHKHCLSLDEGSCLPEVSSETVVIQGLGDSFSISDVQKLKGFFSEKGKQVTFISRTAESDLFQEKNERSWKWTTLFTDSTTKETSLPTRAQTSYTLGPLVYDTDVLVSTKTFPLNGSLFADKVSQNLPLRELFTTSGNEISVAALPLSEFSKPVDWQRIGYLYEVLRSRRIQNLVLYSKFEDLKVFLSTNPSLSELNQNKNVIVLGAWDTKLVPAENLEKAKQLMEEGKQFEKLKDFEIAYDKYYSASSLLPNQDSRLPDIELKLAELKTQLFPSVAKKIFFEPLLNKYKDKEFQNKIRYSFYVTCYTDKDLKDCGEMKNVWIGPLAGTYEKALEFYQKLRLGKVRGLQESNEARKEIEKGEDAFLQSYRLGTLYIQNYLLKEAEEELKRTYSFARSAKEKNTAKNRELEILFHKGLLFGDVGIDQTTLTSTSAYSLGFRKKWSEYDQKILSREFTKYGYADSIYDQFRIKLYQSWKAQVNRGYFDPLILTPEFLTTGESVLSKLSHLNRTLMYSLLRNSIMNQKQNEVNALIDLIISEEKKEERPMRILAFRLFLAESLYLRGDRESADKYLKSFESEYLAIGMGNSFLDEEYLKLIQRLSYLYKRELPNRIVSSHKIGKYYETFKNQSPNQWVDSLNALNSSLKNEWLSPEMSKEMEFLFAYLLQTALEKNSSEVFFDIAIARDLFRNHSERYLGKKVTFAEIPRFFSLAEKLKLKLPKGQEFSAIFDLGKKTYLLSFQDNKSLGRELFMDNKELKKDLMKYWIETEIGGMEMIQRESLADRYKNSLRLSKGKRHYLYLSGYHSKAPLSIPDIELYRVASVKTFIDSPNISKQKLKFSSKQIGVMDRMDKMNPEDKIINDLMIWEVQGKNDSAEYVIDPSVLRLSENTTVSYENETISSAKEFKNTFRFLSNNRLGESTFYSDDFAVSSYYLSQKSKGLFVLHSGIQNGFQNIKFLKQLMLPSDTEKPLYVRFEEAKEAARSTSPEDRYWTGYSLFTSAMITED